MADRTNKTPGRIPVVGQIQVRPTYAPVRVSNQLSTALGQVSETINRRLDEQAEQDGIDQGKKAGALGVPPEKKDNATIRGKAFNRAALQTYTTNVELKTRRKIQELATEHSSNPKTMKEQMDQFGQTQADVLGELDPAARDSYLLSFEALSQPHVAKAKDTVFKAAQDRAEAGMHLLEAQTSKDIDQLASGVFSENEEIQMSTSLALGTHLAQIRKQFGEVDTTTGLPLFSEVEQAKAEKRFFDRVISSGVRSHYRDSDNKAEVLMGLRNGDMEFGVAIPDGKGGSDLMNMNVREQLSIEALDKLESALVSELNFEHTMRQRAETASDKALGENQKAEAFEMWTRVLTPGETLEDGTRLPPVTPDEIISKVEDGILSPTEGAKLFKGVTHEYAEQDDTGIVDSLEERIYSGLDVTEDIQEFRSSLTGSTASSLRKLNAAEQRRATTKETTAREEQRKRLVQTLTPSFTEIETGDAKIRRQLAKDEYDRRAAAIDPEDTEALIVLRGEIIERASRERISDATQRMLKPRGAAMTPDGKRMDIVATRNAIKQLFESGQMTRADFERERDLLLEWNRVYQEFDQRETNQ